MYMNEELPALAKMPGSTVPASASNGGSNSAGTPLEGGGRGPCALMAWREGTGEPEGVSRCARARAECALGMVSV